MKRTYNALEHNIDLWTLEANKNYRITFRYYFDKSSNCGFKIIPMTAHSNFWVTDNRVVYDAQSVTFNNDAEGSWRVGEIYLKTGDIVSGYDNLFLRIVNNAGNNTTPCTVYFDEFRIEEKAKTELINPVSSTIYYAGFENYPADPQTKFYLMQDTGATAEDGKTYKNNMSVISGASVFGGYTDGNIVKYDHVKGSYCSNHKTSLSYSYAHYNAIYPNINININNGSSYKVTFSYKAEKVDTPVQMGWFMAAYSNQWTGGKVNETLGYTISAPTNDWVTVSYIIKFPDSYTMNQGNECKLAHLWMYMEKDADVLIYFDNYYVQEIPTVAFVDEYGNKTYISGEEENKVKFPETEGSHDVYAEDGTGNTVSGSNWYSDENYLNVVDGNNVYFTKERLTVYYQKYDKSIEYGSDQQSYCGFENSSVVPIDGYIDATNKYIISRYDKGYTENGVFIQDEWSLAGYNGFESGNFKIADTGYMSEHSLSFKQVSSDVNKKIADISNGVLLKNNTSYRLTFAYKAEGNSNNDLTLTFTNAKNTKEYGKGTTVTVSADKVTFNVGNYPKVQDIRFIRQQEACIGGAAVITGFNMAGELYKSEETDLLIEYIGDSITTGIGVHRTPDGWANDGTNSYAFLSAINMGVDWRIRSRSGIGAYKNSGGGMGLNSDWLNSYHIENGWRNTTTPYNESREADVVVLYLGTNDNWGFKTIDTEAEIAELAGGMKQLIDKVKSYNPNAKIVWVSGGMTDKYRESARRAIEQSGGIENGYFLCDVPLNMSAGQNGHPDAKQQRIIARSLQNFLETNVLK